MALNECSLLFQHFPRVCAAMWVFTMVRVCVGVDKGVEVLVLVCHNFTLPT